MKNHHKINLIKGYLIICLSIFTACQTNTKQQVFETKTDTIHPILPPSQKFEKPSYLKLTTLMDYVISAKTIVPNVKNGQPFDKLQYDKVIAYDYEGSEEPYPAVIDNKGRFVPVVLAQQYLTQEQADQILSTLAKKSTYGEGTAACFQPHFALVFYKDNKMMHQINVCLDCNYQITDLEIPAETHKIVNKGKEDEFALTGYSISGKKAIIDLCKELHFTYGQLEIEMD